MKDIMERTIKMCEEISIKIDACRGCGKCCHSRVTVLPEEMEKIKKMAEEKGVELEVEEDIFLSSPCPFLHEGKCMIYGNRPLVCRMYPFKFLHGFSIFLVGIDECPLARKIHSLLSSFSENIEMMDGGSVAFIPLSTLEKLYEIVVENKMSLLPSNFNTLKKR